MKKIVLTFLVALLATAAFCQPWDGPFGLKMGLTYKQLKDIDPSITKFLGMDDIYIMKVVPKPHPDYEQYTVIVRNDIGLGLVLAMTSYFKCTPEGDELKEMYREHSSMLKEIYGTCKENDYLEEGSVWTEPQEFMMGLMKKERELFCSWSTEHGSVMKNSIIDISLIASAKDLVTGYISLSYTFSNMVPSTEEMENRKRSAF